LAEIKTLLSLEFTSGVQSQFFCFGQSHPGDYLLPITSIHKVVRIINLVTNNNLISTFKPPEIADFRRIEEA
ncbi:MAG: hypothetical protein ACN4GW_08330, partial [Desulforhopalus sp.]